MWIDPDDNFTEGDDKIDSDTEQRLYAEIHHDHLTSTFNDSHSLHNAKSVDVMYDSTSDTTGKIVRSVPIGGFISNKQFVNADVKGENLKFTDIQQVDMNLNISKAGTKRNFDVDVTDSKYHVSKKCKMNISTPSESKSNHKINVKNKKILPVLNSSTSNEVIVIDDIANNYFENTKEKLSSKRKKKISESSDDDVVCLGELKTDVLINIKSVTSSKNECESGEEEFSVTELQKSMTDSNWDIELNDKYRHVRSKVRYFGDKLKYSTCNNCKELGHLFKHCTKPQKLNVCFLCGERGHVGYRCRNSICSKCLNIGHMAENCRQAVHLNKKCFLCSMVGHLVERCPDLWRRFYLTTSAGDIVKGPKTFNNNVQCYNCCSKKHFGHECKSKRMNPHNFPHHPGIFSYNQPDQPSNYSEQTHNDLSNWQKFKSNAKSLGNMKKNSIITTVKNCFHFPRTPNRFTTNEGGFHQGSNIFQKPESKKERRKRLFITRTVRKRKNKFWRQRINQQEY